MSSAHDRIFDGSFVGEPAEFINYECEMNTNFKEYLKFRKFEEFGFGYNVITILGCQSSGKSKLHLSVFYYVPVGSLLNALFGVEFQVMDTKGGHCQTTKGLWASLVRPVEGNDNSIIVIDVEGTDSRERGEGRLTFEHRSALLCLALSDCVIINLWYHSLGNLTGSNYALLKTVVEANLELASNTDETSGVFSKTTLLFCVRDWFPELAPLDTIRNMIIDEYMASIWKDIQKPEVFRNVKLEDLFHLQVYGLCHGVINPDGFKKDVKKILSDWKDDIRPKKYSRNVPSDGFYLYANNIWKTIKEQNHLDIPSQREMLANFRCSEISANVLKTSGDDIAKTIESQNMDGDFKSWAKGIIMKSVDSYMVQASRYDEKICRDVASTLIVTLCQKMQPLFEQNTYMFCKELVKRASIQLEDKFTAAGKDKTLLIGGSKPSEVWSEFLPTCKVISTNLSNDLMNFMNDFRLVFDFNNMQIDFMFDVTPSIEFLNVSIKNEIDLHRIRHLELFKEQIKYVVTNGFKLVEGLLIERTLTSENYWNAVNDLIENSFNTVTELFSASYKGLMGNVLQNEFEYFCLILLLQGTRACLERVEENVSDVIISRFEAFFQYVEYKGEIIPRDFSTMSAEDLKNVYAESKKEALNLVVVLRECKPPKIKIPNFNVDSLDTTHLLYRDFSKGLSISSSTLLSEENMVETKEICKKKFHDAYRSAQLIQSSGPGGANWRSVPPMFWLLLLICGWNELFAIFKVVLKIQLLIPLLVILYFGGQYCLHALFGDHTNEILDPIKQTALQVTTTGTRWVVKQAVGLMRPSTFSTHDKKNK